MKTRKGLITAVFIVLLTVLAIFPAQSEAVPYGLVTVNDTGVVVDGTPYLGYTYFDLTVNQPGNTISKLSFYNSTAYDLTARAAIASLTVEAGAKLILSSGLSGTIVEVNGGTIQSSVANSSLVEAKNSAEINSTGNAVAGTSGNVKITDSSVTAAGGVGIHSTGGSVTATGSVISADQDAILYTDSNVTVIDSELTAGLDGITETGGSVTVTGSTIEADSDAIYGTDHNVTVTDSGLFASENGISETGGSVTVTDSTIDAGYYGIVGTGGNVTVTGPTSVISGGLGGIYNTGGYVQIETGVTVDGGTGAAVSDTTGSVVVGSALGGATITGAGGIINTGGDLTVIQSDITAYDGDAIRGVIGDVDISDSSITAYGGSGVVLDGGGKISIDNTVVSADVDGINISNNSVYGNVINNLDITAGDDGLVARNTDSLTVNLTDEGSIDAFYRGIYASDNTTLAIDSSNGSGLDITARYYGIEVSSGATLNNNVETSIATSGSESAGVYAQGFGSNANFTEALTVHTSGVGSYGILLYDGGEFNASKDVVINTDDLDITGIYAHGEDSVATIDGITSINMEGDDSTGVIAADHGTVNLNNELNLDATGGGEMKGLFAENNGNINVSGGYIYVTSTGGDAYGADARDGSLITFNNFGDITVLANGGNAYGLYADPSTISGDVESITVTASGSAYGAAAYDESTIVAAMSGDITATSTTSGEAIGIGAETSSDVTITGLENLTVKATDGRAIGIGANEDSSADVSMTGDIKVETEDGMAYGAAALDASKVYLTGAKAMVVSSDLQAFGVSAYDLSTVSADVESISVTGGQGAYGAVAEENDSEIGLVMSGDMVVESTGIGVAMGIGAQTSGHVNVEGLTDLTVTGTAGPAIGIIAGDSSDAYVTMSGNIDVVTANGDAYGAAASGGNSYIVVTGPKDLTVTAADGRAIGIGAHETGMAIVSMAGDINVETEGGNAYGAAASNASEVYITGAKAMVVSSDANAFGVNAYGGSLVDAEVQNNIEVTAGVGAYGALAEEDSVVDLTTDGDIIVESTGTGEAVGIGALTSGDVNVNGLTGLTVKATDGRAIGIGAEDFSNATVEMDVDKINNDIFVHSVTGGNVYGMLAHGDSDIVFENVRNLVVSADGGDAYGLFANDPSTISGDVESITVTASGNAYGAYAYSESTIDAAMSGDITVTSATGDAYGIFAETSSDVTITGLQDLTVQVTAADSNYAYGINAEENSSADVTMTGNILVTTAGTGESIGVAAEDNSYAILSTEGSITVESETGDSYGIAADTESSVTVDGLTDLTVTVATEGNAYGINAYDSSSIDVSMSGDITVGTENGYAYGVIAEEESEVYLTGAKAMEVTAVGGDAYGVNAYSESTVSGDIESITVTATGDAYGATAQSRSHISLTGAEAMVVSADLGEAYGLYSLNSSTISADIESISVTGSEKTYGAFANNGSSIDLTMDGSMQAASTTSGIAMGIGADNGSDITVTGLDDLTVTATDGTAIGIGARSGSTTDVSMDGDITVGTLIGDAYGATAQGGSHIGLTGAEAMVVSADAGEAYGLYALNSSTISADVESISATGSENTYGAYANGGSSIDLTMDGSMQAASTEAGLAMGIGADNGSHVMVGGLDDLTVTATDGTAIGIGARSGSDADVQMSGDITVGTAEGNAYGATAQGGSHISLGGAEAMVVSADAGEAYGLYALNSSTISADVESISATGSENTYGAYANGGSSIDLTMAGGMQATSTEAGLAMGIGADNGSHVMVGGLDDLTVTATDGTAIGIGSRNSSEVYVTMTGDITVGTSSGDAYGATAQGDSYLNLTGAEAMVVSSDAGDAYGLYAINSSSRMRAEVESIEVTASGNAYGIGGVLGGEVEAILNGDVTVTSTSAGEAVGIGANYDGGTVVTGLEDLFVTTVSGDAMGIGADNLGYVETSMNGDITVESTTVGKATGIGADNESDVIVRDLEDLFVKANDGTALGIATDNDGHVYAVMNGTVYVETVSGDAFGIYTDYESDVILRGGNLDVTGTQMVRGLYADDEGYIHMEDGNIVINETADSAYMEVEDGGAIYLSGVTANTDAGEIIDEDRTLITTDSYGTLSVDNGTVIGGNMIHTGDDDGHLNITITGGSKIIGAASADMSNEDARIHITLDSLADTWEVTADSYTNGVLTNGGIVDYQKVESLLDYNDGTEPGDFKTVTVANFIGNDSSTPEDETGILQMKADINGGLNDLLVSEGTAARTNRIEIQNLTNSGIERSGTLVEADDAATNLELAIANPDEIDESGTYLVHAGAWSYQLVSADITDAKEWYLERYSLTSTGVGIVSSMVNADTWYREVGTLLNRMGIYRDGDYYGGFWFEAAANKHEIDGGFGSQYDQQFTNFTVGWDKMYEKEKGDLFIGIMGGYGKADRDIGSIGTTDLESTHAALYGIYRTHDGFYATGLVKYNKYDNDMSLFGVDNFSRMLLAELGEDRVKGNWDQDGYGVSLQIGKRMDRENGWYLEPQAQLSWMRINGENYRTNTGIEVGIDDSDSFRGRLGLLVGRTMQMKDETKLDLFGSLSLVHEFDGDTDITMSGGKWTSDLGGTWGVIGAGFNWNFQPGKYVHGGVSYATGDNRDEPWGVYLGLSIELGGSRPAKEETEEAAEETETEAEATTEATSEATAEVKTE